ncbi:hypothetical protein Afil01_65600 [Actinorhabdospora filicis]|uniref:N-acetyltransferase domain-containing protein n=1 Tax=Actinorhabdospora filicis TaxID=1785913 RepID=A0A9W6SSX7_9ACTN|nr:GNAT family N-acetyltransferase [Actinorhabdospora filicis]GLZ81753.1 hypothetical protein Afil01_65600 [Actinorhabdospora filicis]
MRIDTFTTAHLTGVMALCAAENWPSWSDPETVTRALTAPGVIALVALDGETVAGFAHALTDGVTTAYLATLVTAADRRGQGIGKRLVAAVFDRCGLSRMDLLAEDDSVGFYASLTHRVKPGFRIYPD